MISAPMTPTRFPEARAPRGMVATPHLLATQSGVAALRAGGNALDAAIAAAATIAVVYPHMNGLGGDNVWLIADAVAYAREGFTASDGQRIPPPREPDLFTDRAPGMIRRWLWPLYHPDALRRGPLVQRDLARTLEAVRDGGAEAFYRGDVARRLVAAATAAGSPLALEDLAE